MTRRILDLLPWECFTADVWRRQVSGAVGWDGPPRRVRFRLRWHSYRRYLDARREGMA